MRILLYFLLLGLALEHVCSIPIARSDENDELLEVKSNEEEGTDEVENEEETEAESGSGSGSKRNLIEEEVKEDGDASEGENGVAVGKDDIAKADDVPDEGDNQESEGADNQEKESEEEKEEKEETKKPAETPEEETSSKTELTKKTEVPSMDDEESDEGNPEENPENNGESTEENSTEEQQDGEDTGSKRSDLCKRSPYGGGCGHDEGHEEGHEGHGHHHGHHEHEHGHHHHGHHHGFVHEWGEEEGGGHHGHQGHGHHEGHHEHEHEHEHGYGGHEGIGHHGGGGGGGGGYGDGGFGGGYGGGGGGGGGGCGGGCGGGWGRSNVQQQAPPMAFHCRDMVSNKGKKHTKRFCVPIGYNGGYGWPYFHGYPGTGLGQWGWGFPWIKSKVEGSKGDKGEKLKGDSKKETSTKKEQRDHITKKQTVHVGYGYASGDNYRLGFQAGGMGGLESTFTGHLGPATLPEHFKKSVINKRHFGFGGTGVGPAGPVGAGPVDAPGFGGHSTPYGHPVTHPGFTTMGYPGHAMASTDVRSGIQRPKRELDAEQYPEAMLPEDNFQVEDPEKEFAHYQYYEQEPIENEENENTFLYNAAE